MTGKGMNKSGKVVSINTSQQKGEVKEPVREADVIEDYGIEGDVHAGSPKKQISLLDLSDIRRMKERTGISLYPGDFAENLTTEGLNTGALPEGAILMVGSTVRLEVSQIGKKCHEDCMVKEKTGECIMPEKGLFFRVLEGGSISVGDRIVSLEEK